jgi:glucoside 3-dehydrogenase (cytochrome c) hitch-hiker subunit
VSETRRHALKMLGTIGLTCAFPFSGDELYGQHVHGTLAQAAATGPYTPTFFTPAEYTTLARLTDVIIPASTTPSASNAGVPEYIDRVVSMNTEHQALVRSGLAWLETQARTRYGKGYLELSDAEHITILQPLSDEIDRQQREALQKQFRKDAKRGLVYYVAINDKSWPASAAVSIPSRTEVNADDPASPVRLFRLMKNLTADGYYTSRIGLVDELGYTGNTALASFPSCTIREH